MGTAGAASSVVVLGVLCAALASVADVEAAKKPTPALARSLGGLGVPPATTATAKITPLAAPAKTAAAAAKTTAVAARAAPTTASKRSGRPATHRATRKPGAASGDDGAAGTGITAAGAATTSGATATSGAAAMSGAAATTASPGTGSGREGQEVEVSLTDVAVLKSAMPNKPFIKPGMYPFIATVQKTCGACHTRQFCAGAILAPQWVLSMPQCAETHPGEGLLVRAGDSFIWPGDHTPTQRVIEVVWHEAATSTDDYPKYDVILMRLENSFQFGENINAIALAPPTHPVEGALSVVGWTTPGHAEQVELNVTHGTVRGTEECQKIAPQEALAADTLCVQPVEPLPDRCGYDLGDPVFVEAEQPLLVGLLSRWYLPCVPDRPVAALKISSIYAWVYEKVNPPPVTARPTHSTPEATTPTAAANASTSWAPTAGPSSTPSTPWGATTHASSASPWPTLPPLTTLPPTTALPSSASSSSPPPSPTSALPTTPTSATPTSTTPSSSTPSTVTASSPTGSSTSTPPRPAAHVKPMTVSSSSASGALSNTSSTSDAALLAGHMESSLSYSLGTASMDAARPALANSVSVGWANCRDVGGALGMSYALAYSFIGEGAATAASTVNATCLEMNAVQSQGWSISTSGGAAPVSVRAFVTEHLASIPGLPRQPTLKYL